VVVADRQQPLRELRRGEERRADRREPTRLLGVLFDAAARHVEASVRRRSAASALDAALRALDLAEGEIAQAREHVETAKAATVKGMTPRTSTGASPASRRTTTIEPRNPLEEAAWRGIDTASEISRIEFRL